MALEGRLDISRTVLQRHTAVSVTLRNSLAEHLRNPQQFLLARLPHTDHDGARRNTASALRRHLVRRLCEVLLHPLEESIHKLAHVLRIELLDNLLEC